MIQASRIKLSDFKINIGKRLLGVLLLFLAPSITMGDTKPEGLRSDSIYAQMRKVADWQWQSLASEGFKRPKTDWTNGVLYAGMMEWSKIANDKTYYNHLLKTGDDTKWRLGKNRHFADDYCVGQAYSQLYEIYKDPLYIKDFKQLADTLTIIPHNESLLWVNKIYHREWAWCDALFMGPPALAYLTRATGDQKYLNMASKLWWKTSDYLYDRKERLYYRDSRYFDKKESNGEKVFWSRGNGWVMGGLVRVLDVMPQKHPDRKKFEKQLKEMAGKIASIQQPDGTWHASLLDPGAFPSKETSGTAFYCYALAWGINNGILPYNKFYPVVSKAWQALSTSVHPNGKLGYVQPLGIAPAKTSFNDTNVYGVGAFLMAGVEMIELDLAKRKNVFSVSVDNGTPVSSFKTETIDWKSVKKRIGKIGSENIAVYNAITGETIPHQVIYNDRKKPQAITFQPSISSGTTLYFEVKSGVNY
ncbi:MAG TPA: glycoside hydrolase family 88 protein [Sphingobacteriaceae bacterium]